MEINSKESSNDLLETIAQETDLSDQVRVELEKYFNQGGLLGVFTYFLTYLSTDNKQLAANSAQIPTYLFVMSSLHDDAVDEAGSKNQAELKEFLNLRVTIGDIVFTEATDLARQMPENIQMEMVTKKFREIGYGQLREEKIQEGTLQPTEAIHRVEERGSVWGELAISPIEAADLYSEAQLDRLYTFTSNFLFILTVIDDVEDIPEDYDNDTINIPLIMLDEQFSDSSSNIEVTQAFLDSEVPEKLDRLIDDRETTMEESARVFFDESPYASFKLIHAWNTALEWYHNSICTIPVEENVSKEQQSKIRAELEKDTDGKERYLLEKTVDDFPARFDSQEEIVDAVVNIPSEQLSPTVIMMDNIETLVESVMTTTLEDGLANLRAETQRDTE